MSGTLTYWVFEGENRLRSLKLTVCSEDDRRISRLADTRRMRLRRLLSEAATQGARLSYKDLSIITLTSKATLKRDISYLRKQGVEMLLRGNVRNRGIGSKAF
ncbi:MAG: DUF1670 domain-containing protein [Nitrospirae bacterium]|nr:DUF1670 domain-containing protein [Nitrospirota bacterium]